MADKRITHDQFASEIKDGMTIGIGGWGSRRKPMSLVRAIIRAGVKDLTIVSYGGPDVGLLCATEQVNKVIYGFVSLDSIPLEPHFRKARQTGAVDAEEYDEGMFQLGLRAACQRVSFLPCRAGLGSDVTTINPHLKTVQSPYDDGETFVAMPAIHLDVALIHMHRADAAGNGQYLNSDPYFDDLFAGAADKTFMSCERIIETSDFLNNGPVQTMQVGRWLVDGVIEAPGGAHFTQCDPDYGRDEAFQKAYAATAKDPDTWADFRAKYLDVSEADYQKAVQS